MRRGGGGGVLSVSGPIRKAGGAVGFWPDTKSQGEGGGGGTVGFWPDMKSGGGGAARKVMNLYVEGPMAEWGAQAPGAPPPPSFPWIRH